MSREKDTPTLPKIDEEADMALLRGLTPTIERLLDQHIDKSDDKMWYPHEHIPYSEGRNYEPRETWTPDHTLPPVVTSALYIGLLTEDNLPYYFQKIEESMGGNEALAVWNRRWTAEEGRHAYAIREFLHNARIIDPWLLEEGRMEQMSGGQVPDPESITDGLVYVSLQELATRISHNNTGEILERALTETAQGRDGEDELSEEEVRRRLVVGEAGRGILKLVAGDENRHFAFYSRIVKDALEIDPSTVMGAIERQVRGFAMPGEGIPNFPEHAKRIADAGIYDLRIHHDEILIPVVTKLWKADQVSEGLTDDAKRAQEALMLRIERAGRVATRIAARQE